MHRLGIASYVHDHEKYHFIGGFAEWDVWVLGNKATVDLWQVVPVNVEQKNCAAFDVAAITEQECARASNPDARNLDFWIDVQRDRVRKMAIQMGAENFKYLMLFLCTFAPDLMADPIPAVAEWMENKDA